MILSQQSNKTMIASNDKIVMLRNLPNKIQNDEVSDTTGDDQRYTAHLKKIAYQKSLIRIIA
jgi:hypothetical protein